MKERGTFGETTRRPRSRVGAGLITVAAIVLIAFFAFGCGSDSEDDSASNTTTNSSSRESSKDSGSESSKDSSGETSNASSSETPDPPEPELVTVDELRETAAQGKDPIYWAGERPGTELALSRFTPGSLGRAVVRYLTGGAKADDVRPLYLAVVTYLSEDPKATLQSLAKENGESVGKTPDGAAIYYNRSQPESIFLAFPGVDAMIEVFYPNHFKQALQLVNSGQIVPVD